MKIDKKILHVNYSDNLGGAAISCVRLLNAQIKNNLNSWLFTCDKKIDSERIFSLDGKHEIMDHKIKMKLSRLLVKFFERKKITKSISLFNSLAIKKINLFDCDIVNLHWICNEMISIENIKKINKPLVWTILDMWPFIGAEHICLNSNKSDIFWKNENQINNFLPSLDRWVLKRKLKNFPKNMKIICISNWLKSRARESLIFKNFDIEYIPCTLNFNEWKIINKVDAREKLNLPKNKKIILFISASGTNDYRKGFHILKKMLKKLKNIENFHLLIVGTTSKKDLFDLKIEKSIINKFFFGSYNNLNLIYSCSDLLVVPSLIEPFGQVALEASACGTPVLAFRNTGLEDIIKHKYTGYLADYLNQEDLIHGFNWLMNKFEVNQKKIREYGYDNFSEKIISEKYLKIYNKIY
jgi:glycosyltransferase involved in cell wall biosynthesis